MSRLRHHEVVLGAARRLSDRVVAGAHEVHGVGDHVDDGPVPLERGQAQQGRHAGVGHDGCLVGARAAAEESQRHSGA
eukprot:12216405-Heterocapsa_arctica.AAC.1